MKDGKQMRRILFLLTMVVGLMLPMQHAYAAIWHYSEIDDPSYMSKYDCHRLGEGDPNGGHGWSYCYKSAPSNIPTNHQVRLKCSYSPHPSAAMWPYYGPWQPVGGSTASHKWCPYDKPYLKQVNMRFAAWG